MDSDSCKQETTEGNKSENGDPLPDGWNVYKSIWVRCSLQDDIGFDRLILDYNRYFLPSCGFIFWTIFLLFKS